MQSFVRSDSGSTIHQKPQNQAWSLCGSFLTMTRSTLRGAKTPEGNRQRRGRVFRFYILLLGGCCCSVCKSLPTLCDPIDKQPARPPCPSPTPGAYSISCPSSHRCHPTISCSVAPFSFCLQSFPASGSFPVSQFFASGGQRIGASASVLPVNIQG